MLRKPSGSWSPYNASWLAGPAKLIGRVAQYQHKPTWRLGLCTETRYQYGTGTYVTGMYRIESERRFRCLISVPCLSDRLKYLTFVFSITDVRSIITGTEREKLYPDWENACELDSESSNNKSPKHICSNASVLFSHSDLKAQLGKWEHPRSAWMQWLHLISWYLLFTYPYPWSIKSSLLLWLDMWIFCARAPSGVQYERKDITPRFHRQGLNPVLD